MVMDNSSASFLFPQGHRWLMGHRLQASGLLGIQCISPAGCPAPRAAVGGGVCPFCRLCCQAHGGYHLLLCRSYCVHIKLYLSNWM